MEEPAFAWACKVTDPEAQNGSIVPFSHTGCVIQAMRMSGSQMIWHFVLNINILIIG